MKTLPENDLPALTQFWLPVNQKPLGVSGDPVVAYALPTWAQFRGG